MENNNWTREQLIVAFNFYCKFGFTRIRYTQPDIVVLANLLGRTPSALAIKLTNFARLDPALKQRGVKGMSHGSKGEEIIWNEFNNNWNELAYESERILAKYKSQSIEQSSEIETDDLPKEGKEREALVRVRVNQKFFRKTILASYGSTCCITGLNIPQLLVASHIIPWSKNEKERVNPSNGLCLNTLHDKAFDKGLITIGLDFKIKLSSILLKSSKNETVKNFFLPFEGKKILMPKRFLPETPFFLYHFENVFEP